MEPLRRIREIAAHPGFGAQRRRCQNNLLITKSKKMAEEEEKKSILRWLAGEQGDRIGGFFAR
jgi:hypothetical protein